MRQHVCEEVARFVRSHVDAADDLQKPTLRRKSRRSWADEFSSRCARFEKPRKNNLPAAAAAAVIKAPEREEEEEEEVPEPRPPKIWRHGWNRVCEYCLNAAVAGADRVECRYCNVVAHRRCADAQPQKIWVCRDCVLVLDDCRRAAIVATCERRLSRARHLNSVAIQARARAYIHNQPFRKLRRGVVAIQGVVRCISERRRFRALYSNEERPYHVRVVSASGILEEGEYFGIVSIVRNQTSDDLNPLEAAGGATLFQFFTRSDRPDASGRLNNVDVNVLVPSTVCGVTVFVTLVAKTNNNAPTTPNPNNNNNNNNSKEPSSDAHQIAFYAQASSDLEYDLLYYRRAVRNLSCITSSDDCFEPREKPGSLQALRMLHRTDRTPSDNVVVKLELAPCPVSTTHHGLLEEVSSIFSRKAVKRRWWCLLAEHVLHFYRSQSDQTPLLSFHLGRSHLKFYHQSAVLEIKCLEKTMLVSQHDANARAAWFRMLKKNWDSAKLRARSYRPSHPLRSS